MSADLARKMRVIRNHFAINDDVHLNLEAAACLLEANADNQPFWIVMALDSPGPVERGLGGYVRQPDEATAKSEARRLAGIHGGRFAVLRAMHVIGWQEVQMDAADRQLPF